MFTLINTYHPRPSDSGPLKNSSLAACSLTVDTSLVVMLIDPSGLHNPVQNVPEEHHPSFHGIPGNLHHFAFQVISPNLCTCVFLLVRNLQVLHHEDVLTVLHLSCFPQCTTHTHSHTRTTHAHTRCTAMLWVLVLLIRSYLTRVPSLKSLQEAKSGDGFIK